ncbi:MAG: formate dehydrogenase subunit delta [Pseudomonadota bacterium]
MEHEKLVTMANQIARFFLAQGPERAVEQTADHLQKFWDPRMRHQIRQHLASGGDGLDPVAKDAVANLPAT